MTEVVRGAKAKARLAMLKNAMPNRPGVRVEPRDDIVRRYIGHPRGGIKFRSEGSIEWPNDRFTQRRLLDGTVRLAVPEGQGKEKPHEDESHGRHGRHERE